MKWVGKAIVAAAVIVVIAAAAAAGCDDTTINWCDPSYWTPNPPDPDLCGCLPGQTCSGGPDAGPNGTCPPPFTCVLASDAGDGGADGPIGAACLGQCVPTHP